MVKVSRLTGRTILITLIIARVGKSSITLKYSKNEFSDKQESTVDATYNSKDVMIDNKTKVGLTIWDTAG